MGLMGVKAILPEAMARFRRQFPLARVHIVERFAALVQADLRNETLDFAYGVKSTKPVESGIHFRPLNRVKLAVYARKGHRFALEGFPSVGRKDAPLTFVNFTDFLCDECPAYNLKVTELLTKHGIDVRFVFIPFPYTRPDKAMALARGAMCAQEQGAYLDYHMKIVSLGSQARKAGALLAAEEAGLDARAFAQCYRKGTGVAGLLSAAQVEACYPGFRPWLAMKKRYDPGELFCSSWYAHYRDAFAIHTSTIA